MANNLYDDALEQVAQTPGNIDLTNRPRVKNPDGSVSTVRSMSINEDGREILIPTVVGGRVVSDDEAIDEYHRSGQHLGIFGTEADATAYAQTLHASEAAKLEAPPGPSNPYEDTLHAMDIGRAQRLRTVALQADRTTPDRAADVQRLSREFGIPAEIVERNFDAIKRRGRVNRVATLATEAPRVAEWLGQDGHNMAVAQDDLESLTAIDRTLLVAGNILGAAGAGVMGFSRGVWGLVHAGAELARAPANLVVDFQRRVLGLTAPNPPASPLDTVGQFAHETAGVAGQLAETARGTQPGAGFLERNVYGGVESVGNMVPGLVLAMVAGPEALLTTMGATTAGQAYEQARDQGVGVGTSAGFGAVQGLVEVATEYIPAHRLFGDLAKKTPFLVSLAHQMASEIPGEEIATVLQDLNEWAVLPANKDRTFQDYLRERPSAAAATAISTIVATGLQTAGTHATVTLLEQLGAVAEQSKTNARSPEAVQDFVDHVVRRSDGRTPSTLYAPLETWKSYWQSQGVDPAAMAEQVTGSRDAYQQAVEAGTDLPIPLARYTSQLAGTPHNAFFTTELRLEPEQMNGREAAAFEAQMAAAVDEPAAAAPVESPVRTAVLAQLEQAGVPAETAQSYATLYESAFASLAQRAGVDPHQLFERYGLTIARPDLPTLPEAMAASERPAAIVAIQQAIPALAGEKGAAAIARLVETAPASATASPAAAVAVDTAQPDAHTTEEFLNAPTLETGDAQPPATAEAGVGRTDRVDEQPGADQSGLGEGARDGGRAEPRRIPSAPALDETFERRPLADTTARLTPEVRRELERVKDELETFPFIERTWNWLEGPKTGNAAGGAADIVAGSAGAQVYHDVRAFSPVNRFRGKPAREVRGTRGDVLDAIRTLLETGDVHNNLAEGALRVAEHRDAGRWGDLSAPELPPAWGTVAPVAFTDALSEAIDLALATDAIEPEGAVDTSFNVDELDTTAPVDELDTGELQPRLPGDAGAVRDVNVPTPQLEAPFSLSAESAPERSPLARELFQALFHGSPHDVDQFSSKFIGSGEGAQAYGHGLYFAENQGVAEGYQRNLSEVTVDGTPISKLQTTGNELEDAIAREMVRLGTSDVVRAGQSLIESKGLSGKRMRDLEAAMGRLVRKVETGGHLYQVDIPDEHLAKMLDWDKPLSEQSAHVQAALEGLDVGKPEVVHRGGSYYLIRINGEAIGSSNTLEQAHANAAALMTGEAIYHRLQRDLGSDTAASQALADAGIPGVRYLDQGSRGTTIPRHQANLDRARVAAKENPTAANLERLSEAEELLAAQKRAEDAGTRNVVVFDDSIVKLTHKDGTAVTPTERKEFFQSQELGQDDDAVTPPRRGSISFGTDRQFSIKLLEHADLSTFLHESGHFFLEVFTDLAGELATIDPAARTEQQQHLLADHAETLAWLAKADPDHTGPGFSTAQHEQFARGFEAYLMEGKAPSLALHTTFARFRAWLVGVYRSLKGLSVHLTPEVRAVMDRLLASDQAIADVEAQRGVPQMFTTAESASMSEGEFGLYTRTIADASKTAREQLDRQLLADVQRERTATWKAQRAEVQTAVEAEVHQEPVYRALAAILKGELPNGDPLVPGVVTPPLTLSRELIAARYGAERARRLPRGLTATDGLDPDSAAHLLGFSSGDALLNAVEHARPMSAVIEQETSRRMLAEHGNLLLDGTLHEKAKAAVANEDRDAVIKQELRALARLRRTVDPFLKRERAAGRRTAAHDAAERDYERRWFEAEAKLRIAIAEGHKQVEIDALTKQEQDLRAKARGGAAIIRAAIPPAAVLRATAEARIAAMKIGDVKPQVYWAASRRAAQQAIERAARQDFEGAIAAKQQELINLNLFRQAEQALEDIEARVRFAKDLAKPSARKALGLAGATYLDQVDGILDRFQFAPVSQTVLDRRASLRDWAEALEAQGLPVDLPEDLLNEARRRHYTALTVEELRGITDGLKQIQHLARLKNRLLKAVDQRDFDVVRDGVVDSIRTHSPARAIPLEFRPSDAKWRGVADWFASHTKVAILARALDGHVDGGAMWEAFVRPMNAAADAEITRKQAAGAALTAILDTHYPGRELASLNEKREIPAIKRSLSKEARLAVALNWGNQTSRDRLLADQSRKWTPSQVQAILDTLDARDWQFVQATWDYLNTFWSEIAAKQERVTGLPPDKVAPLPVVTPFGDLAGGYYPLAYDGRLAPRAEQLAAAGDAKLAVAAAYVASTTKRGHTKTRLEHVTLPVRLELGVAFRHVEQVIHDLTHHEMLIDTTRLLRDPAVTSAILETKGDQVFQQFTSMLQDLALGSANGTGKPGRLDGAATFFRTHTQIAGMGWNLWTALQQPLGLFNGMSRVGPVWVARGMSRWLRDAASMQNTATWIASVSPMMRERVTTATQDLHDVKQALSQPGGWFDTLVRTVSADHLTQQTITDGYLWHIGMAQRVADIPTWLGGYEKAMAAGNDEARAIALADQGVLDSQGGGQIKDLAQVQRGGPVAKLFMTFYSYGNTVFNATADVAGATNFKSPASVATFLGHMSLILIMPAIATEALRCATGKGTCTEWPAFATSVGGQMLGDTMNMMVGVRELGNAAKLAAGLDPGSRGYEGLAGLRPIPLLYKLAQQVSQREADAGLAKAANAAAGILFRYPAAQVQRTVDGWTALEDGRTTNPLALLFGAPPKGKK